jgi:hypothetical protein
VPSDFKYKLRKRRDHKTHVEITCEEQSGVDLGIACLVLRRCLGLQTDSISISEQSDVVILCTGDGDFTYLLRTIKGAGKRVVVIGYVQGTLTLSLGPPLDDGSDASSTLFELQVQRLDVPPPQGRGRRGALHRRDVGHAQVPQG